MTGGPGRFRPRCRRRGGPRLVAGLGVLALAAGSLTACAQDEPAEPLTVTGAVGAPPVVQFPTPLPLEPTTVEVVAAGEGRALEEGAPVVLATTSYDGDTGEVVDPATAGRPRVLRLDETDLGPDLAAALPGVSEGSRLVVTQPVVRPEATAPDAAAATPTVTQEETDRDADTMLVVVVDVLPSRAGGEPVEVPGDLPVVLGETADGAPTVAVPEPVAPQELRVVPLRRGTGGAVVPGQEVTLQYLGVDLSTGETYDSTWAPDRGPQVVGVDETFPGLRQALLDQPVGSRVLVVAPPEQAFGDAPLALVVDVLAAHGGDEDRVVRAG